MKTVWKAESFCYIAAWVATLITTAIVVDLIYFAPDREAKKEAQLKLLKELEEAKKKED